MKIAFITLTNTGYIEYTLNCLSTLKNIGLHQELHCYCIGEEGYEILKSNNYKTTLIKDNENSKFEEFRSGNWSSIVQNKFKIIHENLINNDYVCYTDGDIVYENIEFYNYLIKNIGDYEMLIQNDTLLDNDDRNLCSGFMFIKSNENTKEIFESKNTENKKNEPKWGDQVYINDIKEKIKYKKLPLSLYPNGKYYYENALKIKPYMIHFNWLIGHNKKKKMKEYKKWKV
jgi:hypothetical protein